MESNVTITINEFYDDGRVVVKTFKVRDENTYNNILDELQFCRLKTEYTIYPDRK